MSIEDEIRQGQILRDTYTDQTYRGVFIGGNFYLYRLVEKSFTFRGDTFNDDTLVLVYSNIHAPQNGIAPSQVKVRQP